MEEKKKSSDKKSNEKLEFQWKKAGKTSFIWKREFYNKYVVEGIMKKVKSYNIIIQIKMARRNMHHLSFRMMSLIYPSMVLRCFLGEN